MSDFTKKIKKAVDEGKKEREDWLENRDALCEIMEARLCHECGGDRCVPNDYRYGERYDQGEVGLLFQKCRECDGKGYIDG